MGPAARRVQRTYLALALGNTLATSFIWGVNTLFLLDAGLTNLEAFAANAFFTLGMVVFEIPTGVVADTAGRRTSFLLGTVVLAATTAGYVGLWWLHAPFWAWALVSVGLGLGYTFFSGATEAWLVDAMRATGHTASLEPVFGRAQVVGGLGMLVGSVAGGVVAQATSLGVPFVMRVVVLLVMAAVAAVWMHDLGFTPERGLSATVAVRRIVSASVQHGLARPAVRWLMVAGAFLQGVGIYAFYAAQPYLLDLYGDRGAYAVAGLAAALVACSQMVGGALAGPVRRAVRRRTTVLLVAAGLGALTLLALGLAGRFWAAVVLIACWGVVSATAAPVRQAYLNDLIPSGQRATVLSFDSVMASLGGVGAQPALGRVADLRGYGVSLVVGGAVQLLALPFLLASRRSAGGADEATTLPRVR